MMKTIGRASLVILLSCAASSLPLAPAFEVASVSVHQVRGGTVGISMSGPRFNAEAKTVTGLILYAYDVKSYQVPETKSLLPFGDIFYDIAAKAEGDTARSKDEFRQMLQSLLADRFKLRIHHERREMPVYALIAGRNGPKFKAGLSAADSATRYTAKGRSYEVLMPRGTMDDVVHLVENSLVDRPVLDKTGLAGSYEIRMTYTPNTLSNRRSPDPDDISIFTAVQTLGLQLRGETAAVDVLVVDHLEKPSEN
ncbi:MAG: TIGR03435 family protein [Acidobacteriota bacterium]